jgi:UDP-N-acetylglucosamine 2-epimerase (non-hydrolysing)
MVVYGTRPEAIKMAPVVAALGTDDRFDLTVAVTGQHREMLDQVNALFGITPDIDLDLMSAGASLSDMTARTVQEVGALLRRVRPDVLVVQGDTTSAFCAGLAAFYEKVPVVHLEAGLRTGDIYSPFPEEVNRRLVGQFASLHLAPTGSSRANLLRENVRPSDIAVTGNTVIDALWSAIRTEPVYSDHRLGEFLTADGPLLLVTAHRRESWGAPMRASMEALRSVLDKHPESRILLPMHRNEKVRSVVEPVLGGLDNVLLTEPLGYHEFSHAIRHAHIVITDSGGVQEEAPSLGKPVLVMRDTTERPEAVDSGTVRLVGTRCECVLEATLELLEDQSAYEAMANATNPYGDGHAAERAVAAVAKMVGEGERLPDFDPDIPLELDTFQRVA